MCGMDLIDDIRARLRAAPNLSDVARRAGMSRKALYRIRDGAQSPTLRTVGKVLRALGGEDLTKQAL